MVRTVERGVVARVVTRGPRLLAVREDIHMIHSSFVFSILQGTFLGPLARRSKLSLRRAIASKSSVLPVNLRV